MGKPEVHLQKGTLAHEEISLLYEHDSSYAKQIFSGLLSEETGDKKQSGSTAQEEGDPLCGSNKTDQSDFCPIEDKRMFDDEVRAIMTHA